MLSEIAGLHLTHPGEEVYRRKAAIQPWSDHEYEEDPT
jgi:hypothetical protein